MNLKKIIKNHPCLHIRLKLQEPVASGSLTLGTPREPGQVQGQGEVTGPGRKPRNRTKGKGGQGGGDPKPAGGDPKPNYHKKMGTKISGLSSKVTEIRCLNTNLASSNLSL